MTSIQPSTDHFPPKLCECGCRQATPIAQSTDLSKGRIKGEPCRYVRGHFLRTHPRPIKDAAPRFWSRVDQSGGPDACWPFTGARGANGYGHFYLRGTASSAHRAAYELTHGPIAPGLFVMHKCDNPPCCNPDHLELGTHEENMTDMRDKGRSRKGPRPSLVTRHGTENPHAKLTEDDVREIRRLVGQGTVQAQLARRYGVCTAIVCEIVSRKRWKHVE